ncbi:unnamed protein product [Rotaria magnacalcarata]|uniref:Uncharacterized protein n=1 Tax=Rotaria magnacalcarata TaxID=392030 RepID=A0A816BBZ5_9BILA|nr:unnamed protein product [Rotaria magnacalcarata]CAF4134592.1 unnamed protein product [Rotaria magnacalcarata]
MEGSRSVKNAKEIEQLLRDYPAALEIYRTGKYEVDIERVILVEKRSTKVVPNNETETNGVQQNYQSRPILSTDLDRRKQEVITEKDSERSRNRAESDRRTRSRDSPSNVLQSKHTGKKSSRDHRRVLVPFMTNGTQTQDMWQSPQSVQHYFIQPAIQQQTQPSNMYMPPPYPLRQNSAFQQPY